jgi:pimeloyl-ACP methyl ester carboxylesterase
VLTHGIGFDRRFAFVRSIYSNFPLTLDNSYWDFPFANYNYSYVSQALQGGYSTFAWDRLGIGKSSYGDPINEIQLWLEVSALHELTKLLKKGTLPGAEGTKFSKAVNVGHSFGSAETFALTVLYPDVTDGIVLTGFSLNGSYAGFFGLGSNFIQANSVPSLSSYPTGYLAAASTVGVQIDFYSPGQFDPKVLDASFITGQPVTPGELLTLGGAGGQTNSFKGPVLVITGGMLCLPSGKQLEYTKL